MKRQCQVRLFLLTALLLTAGYWLCLQPVTILPWPTHCNGPAPTWLSALVTETRKLGYPGFQLSFVDKAGRPVDCVAGWAGPNIGALPLKIDQPMRYASLSKIMTSVVSMQLAEEGRLAPETPLLDVLEVGGPIADARIKTITLGHLLMHTAGFDRSKTPDPMFLAAPWCPRDLERLSFIKLDYPPGTRFAYANVGYCLLGAAIARIEGEPLDRVFERRLLTVLGLSSITPLGHRETLRTEPQNFFDPPDSLAELLAIDYPALVAVGGWAGSARDFRILLSGIFSESENGLLSRSAIEQLLKVDPVCAKDKWRNCHGYGFYKYQETGQQTMYWRDGSLPGVSAFAAIFSDGNPMVFLSNGRRHDWMPANDLIGKFLYSTQRR